MTAVLAHAVDASPRRAYQRRVAALLEEIDQRRHDLYLLRASGALPAGLRELKTELKAVRSELATTLAARSLPGLPTKH